MTFTFPFTFLSIVLLISGLALALQALVGLAFFISCLWERETRAALWGLLQLLGMAGLLAAFVVGVWTGFFHTWPGYIVLALGWALALAAAGVLLWPSRKNPRQLSGTAGAMVGQVERFDERDQVFARNRSLRPDSREYREYYNQHPELEEPDAQRRAQGGPSGRTGAIDSPHGEANVAMSLGCVNLPFYLSTPEKVTPPPHFSLAEKRRQGKVAMSPQEATARVKGFVRRAGAGLVGVAEINPLWIYARRGEIFNDNWEDWGQEIELGHQYAVVFALEMAHDMVRSAPHTATLVESMGNYAKGASIASMTAAFIANLGYAATANHLRHYDLILPAVAVDAGLGEVGRLGYLMTKEFGPRVRLGAVTTDLPLVPDRPVDIGAEDFCRYCKKCAQCCPSQAISGDERPSEHNGTLRWKLDDFGCFNYWGKVGTDCNVCMRVCPWSHARTFPHRLIVWMISRNHYARVLFSRMDDVFYGKRPKHKAPAAWAGL